MNKLLLGIKLNSLLALALIIGSFVFVLQSYAAFDYNELIKIIKPISPFLNGVLGEISSFMVDYYTQGRVAFLILIVVILSVVVLGYIIIIINSHVKIKNLKKDMSEHIFNILFYNLISLIVTLYLAENTLINVNDISSFMLYVVSFMFAINIVFLTIYIIVYLVKNSFKSIDWNVAFGDCFKAISIMLILIFGADVLVKTMLGYVVNDFANTLDIGEVLDPLIINNINLEANLLELLPGGFYDWLNKWGINETISLSDFGVNHEMISNKLDVAIFNDINNYLGTSIKGINEKTIYYLYDLKVTIIVLTTIIFAYGSIIKNRFTKDIVTFLFLIIGFVIIKYFTINVYLIIVLVLIGILLLLWVSIRGYGYIELMKKLFNRKRNNTKKD